MALGITVTKKSPEHVTTLVHLTGLIPGTRYDVVRLHLKWHLDTNGVPVYERRLPDLKEYWSAVQHRTSWEAPATTQDFSDYETPLTPVQYFIVKTDLTGPFEWDFKKTYPVANGVLCPTVVHYYWSLRGTPADTPGMVRIRSTAQASVWHDACVVAMDDIKYTARGTELAVMGNRYPVYVGDVREQRRGSIVVKCESLTELQHLQNIAFPTNGVIRPIIFNSISEPSVMINDMRVIPLDVTVEQATPTNAALRYVHIDFVEIDPTAPLYKKTAENIVSPADANFTISDTTPKVGQKIVVTDTSTGQYNGVHWFFPSAYMGLVSTPENPGANSAPFRESVQYGPHEIFYKKAGNFWIKLWVGDRDGDDNVNTGADSIKRYITVHR
jgi:hypothetical protein